MFNILYYLCRMTKAELNKRIRAKGLLKTFLAKQIGVSKMTLSHAINGTRKGKAYQEVVRKLTKYLKE